VRRSFLVVTLALVPALGLALPLATPLDLVPAIGMASAQAHERPAHRGRKGRVRKRVVRARPVPWLRGNLPNVQSHAAVVVDLDTGATTYARNPDLSRPIASISKLAAGLVAMDRNLDLKGLTTITDADVAAARGGADSRLALGMTVSNLDLLHAGMLGSDNRAVAALGRAVGLPPGDFAREMTAKAAAMGLKSTRFVEPTGLSRDNVSTPRETVALLQAALAHPVLGPILAREEYDAHPVSQPAIKYFNTWRPGMRHNARILGGKTGYNDFARYCLVIAATIDGRRFGMAFLGSEGKLTRFGDFGRTTDWIVARKPVGKAAPASALAVEGQGKSPPREPPTTKPLPDNQVGDPAAATQ
jgi:D-alanyl-D-alanine endopeptidase (penicillin-binding protein 7)